MKGKEKLREREDYKRWLLKRAAVVAEYVICRNCKTEKNTEL